MDLSIVKVALWNMKRTCHGMFHTGIQKYLLSAIKVMRKFIKWCVSDCNNTYKNANHYKTLIDFSFCSYCTVFGTVVTNMTFSSVKPSISPSNLAQNANPGTVLKSAPKHPQHIKIDWVLTEIFEIKEKWLDSRNFQ